MPLYLCPPCSVIGTGPGLCRKCGETLTSYITQAEAAAMTPPAPLTKKAVAGFLGSIKTPKKAKSSAANGRLGGRPKNIKPAE